MSVYVCLMATASAQVLAQKSSSVVTIVQRQNQKGVKPAPGATTTQTENVAAKATDQSAKLSSQTEKIVAKSPASRETFCALLSKYLSLS